MYGYNPGLLGKIPAQRVYCVLSWEQRLCSKLYGKLYIKLYSKLYYQGYACFGHESLLSSRCQSILIAPWCGLVSTRKTLFPNYKPWNIVTQWRPMSCASPFWTPWWSCSSVVHIIYIEFISISGRILANCFKLNFNLWVSIWVNWLWFLHSSSSVELWSTSFCVSPVSMSNVLLQYILLYTCWSEWELFHCQLSLADYLTPIVPLT